MSTRKLIIAHRGDNSQARENTLEAFRLAIEGGADMIEFDVRRTADGELVISHDPAIEGLLLASHAFTDVIVQSEQRGFRVPRLSEVLALTRGKIRLDVELKEAGYESAVLQTILDHGLSPEDFVLTSFEIETVRHLKRNYPTVKVGLLVENMSGQQALELFAELKPDFLAPDYAILDSQTLTDVANSSVAIVPWTVNDDGEIRRLLLSDVVTGIITDRLKIAISIRAQLDRR